MRFNFRNIALIAMALALTGADLWYAHTRRAGYRLGHGAAVAARLASEANERSDEPQEEQEFFVQKRMPGGQGPLDRSLYQAAFAQAQAMQQYSISTGAVIPAGIQPSTAAVSGWTFLGPGNIGGRTRAIIIDPTNTQIMYSAAVAGGVWKTTNGGASWSPTSDFIANIAVNSLIMDPNNHLTLYAGTGEGFFNQDAVRGNGIFKTTDGGNTWTQLASTANKSDFYYVNKMVINSVSTRIYAATRTGVFRSLDGGNSWSKVLDGTAVNGCMDVKIQFKPAAYVFAACGTFTNPGFISRALDSNNSPQSWTQVFTATNMGRTSLAIAPSNQNIIYALSASNAAGNFQYGLLAVYRSTSQGAVGTWTTQDANTGDNTQVNNLLLTNPVAANYVTCGFSTANVYSNQGWYDNIIAVDPTNPNTVWVGGIDLFRSNDGGMTFGLASYWWGQGNPVYSHADHHALVFDPNYNGTSNQIMWDGNDGGFFQTQNAVTGNVGMATTNICGNLVANPVAWTNFNNSYGVTQFYYGTPFPNGATYFGGTQDNGTPLGTNSSGPNGWITVLGGDGGAVAVNPSNTMMGWAENTGLSIWKTTDGGQTGNPFISGISGDSGFLFIAPFVLDPSNANNMWTGGNYIWLTTTATTSTTGAWSRASTKLPSSDSVASIAVAPTNSNTVYVGGSSTGNVYFNTSALSATSTTTWSSTTVSAGCYISGIAVDPTTSTTAWAVSSRFGCTPHVWKTTDGGTSWTPMGGTGANTVPDIPVHTIAINPLNNAMIFIGTDLGVMTTTDGGNNWLVANANPFPNVIVDNLVPLNLSGTVTLYVFTHGRSAWSVQVQQPTTLVYPQ